MKDLISIVIPVYNVKEYLTECFQSIVLQTYQNLEILYNSQLNSTQISQFCKLREPENKFLKQAFEKFRFSTRAYHRILKVARTIADLENKEEIQKNHLAQAISYRMTEQNSLEGEKEWIR